jgi:mono/diheme cytochrome c family protein
MEETIPAVGIHCRNKEPTGRSSFRYETASSSTAYGSQTNRALTFNREENMRKTNNWIAGIVVAAMVLAGIAFLSPPAKADTAEATYKAKCAMCHGGDGKGETPTGKTMKVNDFASETVQKMSDADLTDAIAKGKGKMPAFKTLTADQVKDLVAYVRSFGKKK